jgi:hypothetical protein
MEAVTWFALVVPVENDSVYLVKPDGFGRP